MPAPISSLGPRWTPGGARSPEVTQAEVEVLVQALGLEDAPRRLLDGPCGDACHAIELAKLGQNAVEVREELDRLEARSLYELGAERLLVVAQGSC